MRVCIHKRSFFCHGPLRLTMPPNTEPSTASEASRRVPRPTSPPPLPLPALSLLFTYNYLSFCWSVPFACTRPGVAQHFRTRARSPATPRGACTPHTVLPPLPSPIAPRFSFIASICVSPRLRGPPLPPPCTRRLAQCHPSSTLHLSALFSLLPLLLIALLSMAAHRPFRPSPLPTRRLCPSSPSLGR